MVADTSRCGLEWLTGSERRGDNFVGCQTTLGPKFEKSWSVASQVESHEVTPLVSAVSGLNFRFELYQRADVLYSILLITSIGVVCWGYSHDEWATMNAILLFASSSLADILTLRVNKPCDLSVTSLRFGLVTRCNRIGTEILLYLMMPLQAWQFTFYEIINCQ